MRIEQAEVFWLAERGDYTVDEVARMSGLPADLIDALAECGALPTGDVVLARAAGRLREHFELDERGLAVAVSLLRRVRSLEDRLATLRASMTESPD